MNKRFYGLDLIRSIAFLAIIVFHGTWSLWLDPSGPPDPFPTRIWRFFEFYARTFAFSGFTILFLTSFLVGFKENAYKKKYWLPFFLLLGWMFFSFCTFLKEKTYSFSWDIYPLLGIGFLSGFILLKQSRILKLLILSLSLSTLMIPIWELDIFYKAPVFLQRVLIGQCPEDYADWPLIPWISLIWLGLLLGQWTQEQSRKYSWEFFRFRKLEIPLGIFILFCYWVHKDTYFYTQLGDGWACYTFRQSPYKFWTHLLFWALCIRVSLNPSVQNFLSQFKFLRFISRLYINRYFFLSYLTHYLVLFTLIGLLDPEQKAQTGWILDTIILLTMPLTEILTRFFINLKAIKQRAAKEPKTKI